MNVYVYRHMNKTNVTTGEVFNTIKEAEDKYNVKNVGQAAIGKRKTAGGFVWKFLTKEQ